MFECAGIPYCHILCHELQSYYILNQWNKIAANKPIFDVGGTLLEGCSQIARETSSVQKTGQSFWVICK